MLTKTKAKKQPTSPGGTYIFDKELGRVVQVSDAIPKVASKGRAASGVGPCGRGPCDGSRCPA